MSVERNDPLHVGTHRVRSAFTMIELLVVMGVLALLVSILLPSLSAARRQAQAVACRSNIRQIIMANDYYRDDHDGVYVPGASDFLDNLNRWHGKRDSVNLAFDSTRGPLVPSLGPDGAIHACPSFEFYAKDFEAGNGGYGYNNAYIGVQIVGSGPGRALVTTDQAGAYSDRVKRPGETIMFTDSAFAGKTLIEYSFAEPRFQLQFPTYRTDPSIHFRHDGLANVGWCDGHVDAHVMTFTHHSGFYRSDPKSFHIGWFGEVDDNSLFDLD